MLNSKYFHRVHHWHWSCCMNALFGNLLPRGWGAWRESGFENLVHFHDAFQSFPTGKSLWSAHRKDPLEAIPILWSPQWYCLTSFRMMLLGGYNLWILPPPTQDYFPFIEALDLILVVPLAGSGPLSDSLKPLWYLVSFDGVPGIHSKRLTHFHIFLLWQRGWVRNIE